MLLGSGALGDRGVRLALRRPRAGAPGRRNGLMLSIHPNARTTPAVRAEIARSAEPTGQLARRYGVSTETVRKWRQRGPGDCLDRSARPHKLPWKASEEERAVVCALRRATGFPLDDLTCVVRHFLPHLGRDNVYRILKAAGLSRRPAPAAPERPAGKFKEYELGFVHLDVKHLPKLRTSDGECRKRYLFVAIDRRSRSVHLAVKDDETEASAKAFLEEALAAFPFRVTHVLTDRGSCFTAEGFEKLCRELGIEHRKTKPYTPRTNGMVERFNGRVQREVLGITVAGHRDLERLLAGFNSAYNARRQRVLGGSSPEAIVQERLGQDRGLANPGYRPPSDPCVLPKAMLVIERAKDVSQPDSVGVAEPGRHRAGAGEQRVPGERRVVVEGDRGPQARVEPPEHRHQHRHGLGGRLAGQPGREHEPGLALLEDEHRPGPLADQQVALPVPGVLPLLDVRGPVVDRAPPGDGAARRPGPPPAPPGAPARQQLPELLALLPGPVGEGVDRLERHRTEPALLAALEPARDLLGRPPLQQALADEAAELGVPLQNGRPLAAVQVAALGVHRQVAAFGQGVAPQLAADGRGRPAERPRDRPQAQPLGLERGQPLPFLQLQMRPARHRPIPDCRSRPGPYHKAPGCCASRRTPPGQFSLV